MRYAWREGPRTGDTVDERCRVLAVSERGYRAGPRGGPPDRTRRTEAQRLALLRASHAALTGASGSPRRGRALRGRGGPASKERVERLMREHGIRARHKRRYKVTTDSKHHLTGGREPLESGLHAIRSESDLDIRHYLSVDG